MLVSPIHEIFFDVGFQLVDIIVYHVSQSLAVKEELTLLEAACVSVAEHLHLCEKLVFDHAPLVFVAEALQHLVETDVALFHFAQDAEHLCHHPPAEELVVADISPGLDLVEHGIIVCDLYRHSVNDLDHHLLSEREIV